MDNNSSDNFINQQDKPTTNPDQVKSINNVDIQENGINSELNYNAPNPVINPENTPKYPYLKDIIILIFLQILILIIQMLLKHIHIIQTLLEINFHIIIIP